MPQRFITAELEKSVSLTKEERLAIERLAVRIERIGKGQDILVQGTDEPRIFFLLEGISCAYKVTSHGRRQIVAFHFGGDAPDLHRIFVGMADASESALSGCLVGFIDLAAIRRLCRDYPRIGEALARASLSEGAIFREWITNVGQRGSHERVAHLLCEFIVRRQQPATSPDRAIALPVTQADIADATGLSTVQVNRSIQSLRRQGLLEFIKHRLRILDWDRLRQIADFDPSYLSPPLGNSTSEHRPDHDFSG